MYLPGLGSLEIKSEEGRRILPAVTMLATGNYVVPYVGGEPYLRKPPLINWLVAASFKLFGVQNEWTARLPSVVCVLAAALTFLFVARPSLGANGSFFAALMWLTNFGIIEKGRLIEIEALYVSLFGIAIICWLTFWQQRRSSWLAWIVPALFLALGILAKGPLHLLFFYGIVCVVLFRAGELRSLVHPAHGVGVVLMLGVFAAWAVPYLQMTAGLNTGAVWSRQFTGRLSGEDVDLGRWIMNIPRAFAYGLPWALLLFFVRSAFSGSREGRMAHAIAISTAALFVGINLVPGALPRYAMPLLVPAVWLIANILTAEQLIGSNPLAGPTTWMRRNVPAVALTIAAAICIYGFALVPFLAKREKVRNIARQIDAAVPAGERLFVVDPEYQPFLFYLRTPFAYSSDVEKVPGDARFVLVQSRDAQRALKSRRWTQPLREVARVTDYRKKTVILFALGGDS
ncbi:MAG TPA: glycosyltransferase family 39 protein [Chthoniobacterales bacterium]|nr:glycosyltransferase family 39 protein [Chthoniobacterales bacterium]